jgi:LacI family transcriptional regulator
MTATIKDVARQAGVSVGTVSHVLNGSAAVRDATRQRVLQAIEELDYHPSATARSLRKRRTGIIGIVRTLEGEQRAAFEANDNVFLEFLAGVQDETMIHSVGLLLLSAPPGPDEYHTYERLVQSRQVDGFILLGTRMHDPRIRYLLDKQFPFVAFGRSADTDGFPYVDVDGRQGIADATTHLIALGHRHIAFIEPPAPLACTHDRRAGFREAMAAHGLTVDETLVLEGDFTRQSGQQNAQRLLECSEPPTAVIAPNDLAAIGAIQAAQSHGLEVGRDLSVLGFDDIPLAAHWRPSLTTIHQSTRDIGAQVCRMLLSLLAEGRLNDPHVLLQPELRVRQSTGPAPTD